MHSENIKSRVFQRRLFLLAGFKSALFLALLGRLYHLQMMRSEEYKTFSDSNRMKLSLIPSLRGKILDRNGHILADNRNFYRVVLDSEYSKKGAVGNTLAKLTNLLGLTPEMKAHLLQKAAKQPRGTPMMIKEQLSWKEVAKIKVNSPDLPGVSIDVGQMRSYPLKDYACHLLGYLGPVSKKEITTNPLLNHPDFKIGRSGIERQHENVLRGKVGVKRMEVNAYGISVRELSREPSHPGQKLSLTIDKELQLFAGKRLEGTSGSVTVMLIASGDILALASSPSFDPNVFTYQSTQEYLQTLNENLDKPFINKAIESTYPPGSTFKLAVTLAALGRGVNPDSQVYCPGHFRLGRRVFNCWKKGGHGHMTMHQALQHSCNTYFYTISKKIGIEPIAQMARKLGFGEVHDIGLSSQKSGLVPDSAWKKKRFKEVWQKGDTLNVGIGQGYLSATPIQLAVMAARVAGGTVVAPRLTTGMEALSFADLDIPSRHLELVRQGMISVVNVPGGTAYGSRIRKENLSMAGKTGTSQVISKKNFRQLEKKLTDDELRRSKNHALFVGFAPVTHPRYAISVVIEHGGGGSVAAAPVARDVMEKIQLIDMI